MTAYSFTVTVRDDGADPETLRMAVTGLAQLLRTIATAGDVPDGCALEVTDPVLTRGPAALSGLYKPSDPMHPDNRPQAPQEAPGGLYDPDTDYLSPDGGYDQERPQS